MLDKLLNEIVLENIVVNIGTSEIVAGNTIIEGEFDEKEGGEDILKTLNKQCYQ